MIIKTKILIAENDPFDLELLENELRKGGISYESQVVENEKDFGNALRNFSPDIILSDYSFLSFNGASSLEIRQEISPEIPLILVTGLSGEETCAELTKKGLTDYVLKNKLHTLTSKIKRGLQQSTDKREKIFLGNDNRFKAELLNNIGEAVMASDHNGTISFWNKAAEKTYGWTATEATGKNISEMFLNGKTKSPARSVMAVLQQSQSWSGELLMQRKNGTTFTALITASASTGPDQKTAGAIYVTIDLTERKKTEEKILHISNLYAFISQINQKIVHVRDEISLFRNACNLALEYGKFKMAWIGIFSDDGQTIDPVAQSGINSDEVTSLFNKILWDKDPQAFVLRTETYYITNDIRNEPGFQSWKPLAVKHGICSMMVLPIWKTGKITGTFNLYTSQNDFSNNEESIILVDISLDISAALDRFEIAKQKKEADELLIKKELQFRSILDQMIEGIQIHDFSWKYIYVNDALTKYCQYSREELLGSTIIEKYAGIENTPLYITMQKCMDERTPARVESEFILPDGTKKYFELRIQPVPEGIFILSLDRSSQKKNEKLMLQIEQRFTDLAERNAIMTERLNNKN